MEQKKKHLHKGHRQRLKDKALASGIESWHYHEILELLLTYTIPYKDVNPLAHELMDTFGSLGGVLDAGYEQLYKIKGVGHETALFLSTLPDIFSKYSASKNLDTIIMSNAHKCVDYFRSTDRVKNTEAFYVFCLNSRKKLVKTVKINSEFSSLVNVSISWFAEQILFKENKSIIIMHSHPNGDAEPTVADFEATKMLINAAKALGISFNDHIIVTDTSFFSFADNGVLENLKQEVYKFGYISKSTNENGTPQNN